MNSRKNKVIISVIGAKIKYSLIILNLSPISQKWDFDIKKKEEKKFPSFSGEYDNKILVVKFLKSINISIYLPWNNYTFINKFVMVIFTHFNWGWDIHKIKTEVNRILIQTYG